MKTSLQRAFFLALLVFAPQAFAQREEERTHLLREAEHARERGAHQEALAFAERAAQIQQSPSLRYFIAQQLVVLGRRADGLRSAQNCLLENRPEPTNRNYQALQNSCEELVRDLRTQVGLVRLQPPDPIPEGFSLRVAGRVLRQDEFGTPIAADPGSIEVVATAPNHETRMLTVLVSAGRVSSLRVTLTSIETQQTPIETPPTLPQRTGPSNIPFVVMGVGGALLALSPVFFVLRENALDAVARQCLNMPALTMRPASFSCENYVPEEVREWQSANTMNTMTNVSLGVGIAVLAGGTTWLIVDRALYRSSAQVRGHLLPNGAALRVQF